METNSPPNNTNDEQFSEVQVPQSSSSEKFDGLRKKSFLKFALIFLAIIVIAGAAVFVWTKYFSPAARRAQETQKQYEKYLAWQKMYEDAMRADTYGGKTPQETLEMFIDALKKEDVELASKYFVIEETGERNPKWLDGLRKTREAGELQETAAILSGAQAAGSAMEGYFGFEIRDRKGDLVSDINLKLNTYSNVWKIESL